MALAPAIKRHGGKFYLADWILSHAPEHYITYCEPYFGAGHVFFRHNPVGHSEILNDLDGELMNFWATLANPVHFSQFQRMCIMTPLAEEMFDIAKNYPIDTDSNAFGKNLIQAHQFFVTSRQSRQGLCKDFVTMSKTRLRRDMNEQVSQWLGAVEGLPDIHQRLIRAVILNDNALDVIRKHDHPQTWFYLDPPYMHETRQTTNAYEYECKDGHHMHLLEILGQLKGKFTLSGYHSPLYDEWAETLGWRCKEKEIDNKASSASTKPKMIECIWMNY